MSDNVSVKTLILLAPVGNLEVRLAATRVRTLVVLHVGIGHHDSVLGIVSLVGVVLDQVTHFCRWTLRKGDRFLLSLIGSPQAIILLLKSE